MIKKIIDYNKKNNLISKGDKVVAGVSGGADSVCLLRVLLELKKQIPIDVFVVHINHCIRGSEANEDAQFVKKLCEKYNVECIIENIDVPAKAKAEKMSLEEAGRHARYDAFREACTRYDANKIAIAHNKNDSAETILLSLFRGTGIKGLSGIRARRDNIIRPLLCATRSEIEQYLELIGQDYRTDSTNKEDIYARNKIRNVILPEVTKDINDKAVLHVASTGEALAEIEEYMEIETDKIYEGPIININTFGLCHTAIKSRIVRKAIGDVAGRLKDITSVHINDVVSLSEKEVGKRINLPYGIEAIRSYESIIIRKKEDIEAAKDFCICLDIDREYELTQKNAKIKLELISNIQNIKIEEKIYTKWLDYDRIKNNLQLRQRRTGDFIQINSEKNKKKLKSYFIDEKVPKDERDNVLLLADGSHVIWIIGHRISEEYKVTTDTKRILKITYARRDYE